MFRHLQFLTLNLFSLDPALQSEPLPQNQAFLYVYMYAHVGMCVGNARPVLQGLGYRGKYGVFKVYPLYVWVSVNKLLHATPSEGSNPAMRCP